MAKVNVKYECNACGYQSLKYMGRCPSCKKWASMEEVVETPQKKTKHTAFIPTSSDTERLEAGKLKSVSTQDVPRTLTDSQELNRVLGGGVVGGSLVLLGGDPGIGKSTLLLQISAYLAKEHDVLYVTGEESVRQVKIRADRLKNNTDELYVYAQTDLNLIYEVVKKVKPKFLVIDSIQTIYNPNLENSPGSITQVRECTQQLMKIAKSLNIAIFIVGHVTKEGVVAGPRMLEHMVDTVLYLEGEKNASYRILRGVKNRFGATNEIGVFEMLSSGMNEVPNPSAYMLNGRASHAPGSVITCLIEGTRPIMMEVQALVTQSNFGLPRRTASGTDYNRVNLLMAVMEKRSGLHMGGYDAYLNIAGGMKATEPALDLALSLASSFKNKEVSPDTVCFGEVGLAGEVRAVASVKERVNEAAKLKFKTCILPKVCLEKMDKRDDIKLIGVSDIREVIDIL